MNKEIVIERYKHPKNWSDNLENVTGKSLNTSCGDEVYISLDIKDGNISDCKFNGTGCSICLATTDLLIDSIKGKKVEDIKQINDQTAFELIGMEPESPRKRCATLSIEAVKDALNGVE